MVKNKMIGQRLKTAFFWVSMLVALNGVIGIVMIRTVGRDADVIVDEKYPLAQTAYRLETDITAELLALYSFVLGEADAESRIEHWHDGAVEHLQALIGMDSNDMDRNILIDIRETHEGLETLSAKAVQLFKDGQSKDEFPALMKTLEADVDQMLKDIELLVEHAEADMEAAMHEANVTQKESLILLIAITLAAFFLAYWLGQRISVSITRPLDILVEYSGHIADGNLTEQVAGEDAQDEIGILARAFHKMTDSLREQIQEVINGTAVIASSVSELSASSAQLASSAAENATSISETSATVEEVRQTAELTSTKAGQMADESRRIRETSHHGRESTDETIESMGKIQAQMSAIAETIIQLSGQSQSIGHIIATVDSLAEQSNVLAVNASIEAAKAGEHGKGFSVVAQEVKNLAEQSKQATTQVRNILNEIQKTTSSAVMATEQGNKVVEKGTDTARDAGQAIIALSDSLEQSADTAVQISAASDQQRVGMDQITAAVESINEASQQNAAGARQLEGAVQNLKQLGERLQGIVESYRI